MQSQQQGVQLLCLVPKKYCDNFMYVATWLRTVLVKKY